MVNTSAPSLAYTVYNPVDEWARTELLAYQRGTILVQIADSGAQCFAPEVIALWYKRRAAGNIGDWAMITALPAIGTSAPVSENDDLCALPVGSVYVKSDGVTCVQQLYLKVRQECGAGCEDWVPLLLTVTRAGDEISFDGETNTLNLPIGGNLASIGDGEYEWTGDSGALPYSFFIPTLTDNEDGTYTFNPRDGGPTITINTDSGLTIPADISAVRRPWVETGNAQATNATNVTEAVTIFHTGQILRGVTTPGTTGTVGAELTGNNALGAGNHVMTSATNCTIGSGSSNENKSTANGFVGGGVDNVITGASAPSTNVNMGILAGNLNTITDALNATIGGGINNGITNSPNSHVGGGNTNTIATTSTDNFIGAGESNNITGSGHENVIVGGNNNEITGGGANACIVGGNNNFANANQGQVLGGSWNKANGAASTALGLKSQVTHDYAFLINTQPGANPNTDSDGFASAAASEFAVRCNGSRIYTNLAQSAGVTMAAGASAWSAVSDERAKNNIKPLNVDVLHGYKTLQPVSYFMGENIGAGITAQNFYEAFPWLEKKTIGNYFAVNQAERDGIQDAAIKGLLERVEWLEGMVRQLHEQVERPEGMVRQLHEQVERPEGMVNPSVVRLTARGGDE